MPRATDWTREEVEATVADYLAMLVEYHTGATLNKRAHNRALQRLLRSRSAAAIEYKHQNISAVLVEDGLDYLDGYVPAFNYQDLLQEVVRAQLTDRPAVRDLITRVVSDEPRIERGAVPELPVEVPPPTLAARAVRERYVRPPRPRILDFDLIESQNRQLGRAGEESVLKLEDQRLRSAGKRRLAERIEHVARSQGDGLGYDILSFETDGRERLIEVKTTRRAQLTPFYVSRNERDVSAERADAYHVYRLFRFEKELPRYFVLRGSLAQTCRLEPSAFRASVA